MTVLIEKRANKIMITDKIIKAVIQNKSRGIRLMTVLLEKKGDSIPITEEALNLVSSNLETEF